VPVEVVRVGRGFIETKIPITASLETESQVTVYSRATNLSAELRVEEGDVVVKGQLLALLEQDKQLNNLEKVKFTFENNFGELERQANFFEQKLVSLQGYNNAAYSLDQAKLDRDLAQRNYEYTRIIAPINGTVTSRMVNLGDQFTNNQAMFDIVDFDSMVVGIHLPEAHLLELELAQDVTTKSQSLGDKVFSGSVTRISPVIDPLTGTIKVTVAVNSEDILRPGMYVDVALILRVESNALLVPKKALVYDGEQTFVYRLIGSEDSRNDNGSGSESNNDTGDDTSNKTSDDKNGYTNEKQSKKVERILLIANMADVNNVSPARNIAGGDVIVIAGHGGLKMAPR